MILDITGLVEGKTIFTFREHFVERKPRHTWHNGRRVEMTYAIANHTLAHIYLSAVCRRDEKKFLTTIEQPDTTPWFVFEGTSNQPAVNGLRNIMFATDVAATVIVPVRHASPVQKGNDKNHFASVLNNYGSFDWTYFGPADRQMVLSLIELGLGAVPRDIVVNSISSHQEVLD